MFNSVISSGINAQGFLSCILVASALGVVSAIVFTRGCRHTASLVLSVALLPPIVTLIIMLVNGNIGAGLGVAGTFALVRFRSLPGSAREITSLLVSVAIGLACGMGYIYVAALFLALMSLLLIILEGFEFGKAGSSVRILKISVPENLDYEDLFTDILDKYAKCYELTRVRTVNMGTLYELSYELTLRDGKQSRAFIDALRCRNGNLGISLGRETDKESM